MALTLFYTLRLLASCVAYERYAFAGSRPLGVSKNYAPRLANMSRPSGSSSTYKHLKFMNYKIQN